MYYLGIDFGGTNIAAGIVDEKGNIIKKDSTPTLKERDSEEIINDMINVSLKVLKDANLTISDIEGVGVGCPGIVDNKCGVIKHLSNIGMTNFPLRERLSQVFKTRINIENDANAAALGEYKRYGENSNSFIFVTLGTGIGGGIIIDGKIYSGFNGAGAEIGHMKIEINGIPCPCGCDGCWEQYASVTALIRNTKEAMDKNPQSMMHKWVKENGKVSGRTAFECAKAGDETAKEVVDNYIKYLATGLISIINVFQPERIVIGGGISKEGDYLLNPIKQIVYDCKYNNYVEKTKIEIARLFNDAGIIGAALSVM
ncbi:MAG: ROK family protein [Ruminococcaceae bacterium]|nr:ROK family protein [Oscillospiraceae bacterium]